MIILIRILGRFVVKIEGSWHGFKIVSRGSSEIWLLLSQCSAIFTQSIHERLGYKMVRIYRDKRKIYTGSGTHQ